MKQLISPWLDSKQVFKILQNLGQVLDTYQSAVEVYKTKLQQAVLKSMVTDLD